MNVNREIIPPENMNLLVRCIVCGADVPKGKSFHYPRLDMRYCETCNKIDFQTRKKLAGKGDD